MFEQIKHSNQGIFVLCGTGLWGLTVIYTLSSCLRCCCVDASYSHFVVDQLWTPLTVNCGPLHPSGLILFTPAISQGKGLCLISLFGNSLFCFPLADSNFFVPFLAPQWWKPGVPFLLSFQSASLRILLVVPSSKWWSNHMQTWI